MTPRMLVAALAALATVAWAQAPAPWLDPTRGQVPITGSTKPPLLGNAVNDDVRRPRNYDKQPPIVPHRVDGYQVDKNFNKCLDCHARARTDFSQAVPVSETHYMDRNGKVLPQISTRRYFCSQCHLAQEPVPVLVGNSFEAAGTTSKKAAEAARTNQQSRGSP